MISYEKLEKLKNRAVNILLLVSVLSFLLAVFGAYRPELIMSNSMYPLLKKGNIVLAKKFTDTDTVISGDIYTYKNPDDLITITHRCISKEDVNGETVYVFKGDNNDSEDPVRVRKKWIKYRLVLF